MNSLCNVKVMGFLPFYVSSENDRPPSLTPGLIDYNMPLTTTYLKQMKLQCMNNNEQVRLGFGF